MSSTAMVEIFAATLGNLLLLLIIVNVGESVALSRLLHDPLEPDTYFVSWPGGTDGYAIQLFRDHLTIVETQEQVFRGSVCEQGNQFQVYANRVYVTRNSKLIFEIFEGGVPTAEEARSCLLSLFSPGDILIGIMSADEEILKAIPKGEIPEYIKIFYR